MGDPFQQWFDEITKTAEALGQVVTTGVDNVIRGVPYQVFLWTPPKKWDPQAEALPLSYVVLDTSGQVVSGRILYLVKDTDGVDRIVHLQELRPDQVAMGYHELAPGERWDGTITRGIPDRIGQKVGADLSPVGVLIEVWNHAGPPTGRGDEYLASDAATVWIDVITLARWDDDRCIPYDDVDEPQLGETSMTIDVRNVPEGTPVRIRVARIADIANPAADEFYDETDLDPYAEVDDDGPTQPGLKGATVQGGRVLLGDGSRPFVRWNQFERHWPHWDQNNFYCFHLALGDGRFMVASERDYVNHESDCLHMRFTVFIHRPATDLHEYTRNARALHTFFRGKTKYFRSYLMEDSPRDLKDWYMHFRHRYIVIVLGHAAAMCKYGLPDHPTMDGTAKTAPRNMYHSAFPPDRNRCPKKPYDTPEAKAEVAAAEEHYKTKFGGCDHKERVVHFNMVGYSPKTFFGNTVENGQRKTLVIGHLSGKKAAGIPMETRTPRLCYFNGGCVSITSTNLAEYFTFNGTRYYSGWTYSPVCDYGRFCYEVFTHWIQGTPEDPAPNEFDANRFLAAYVKAASPPHRAKFHPRLTDRTCGLSAVGPDIYEGPVDSAAGALT